MPLILRQSSWTYILLGTGIALTFVTYGGGPSQLRNAALAEPASTEQTLSGARRRFLEASPGGKKGQAANLLLRGRTVEEIDTLRFDIDDGIALCAKWRCLDLQMGARLVGPDHSLGIAEIPPDLAIEFVGFIEGRLKLSVPYAWRRNVFGARLSRSGLYRFPILFNSPFEVDSRSLEQRVESPRLNSPHTSIDISKSPGKVYIRSDGIFSGLSKSVEVPDSLLIRFQKLDEKKELQLTGIAIGEKAILAIQNGVNPGGALVCVPLIQPAAGGESVYWEIKLDPVWSDDYVGSGGSYLELRVRDQDVFVFHSDAASIGVEQISIESGRRVFSFNSSLGVRF